MALPSFPPETSFRAGAALAERFLLCHGREMEREESLMLDRFRREGEKTFQDSPATETQKTGQGWSSEGTDFRRWDQGSGSVLQIVQKIELHGWAFKPS